MADRPALDFGFGKPWHAQLTDAIAWQDKAPEKRWIFLLADAMAPCIDKAKASYIGHANRREWWLFRADAVAPDCRAGKVPTMAGESQENPEVSDSAELQCDGCRKPLKERG